jgi:hypothetical protein
MPDTITLLNTMLARSECDLEQAKKDRDTAYKDGLNKLRALVEPILTGSMGEMRIKDEVLHYIDTIKKEME